MLPSESTELTGPVTATQMAAADFKALFHSSRVTPPRLELSDKLYPLIRLA